MKPQKINEKIIKELNLRKPQEHSLTKLDALMSAFKIGEDPKDIEAKLTGNLKFDTNFPSFTFNLATGVGKTRLMGAMIAYLYYTKGLKDFFILTPGETIYTKTIDNFTNGSKKYVMQGLTDFPMFNLVTGENYAYADFGNKLFEAVNIYIFNIQKIFNERKDVEFRFHKYQETLGSSFAELLQKKDLVILMDESHRYRGTKSLAAINHLQPELGLEFTATPTSTNVVYSYSLADAIKDSKLALERLANGGADGGYIKIPGVVARSDNFAYEGDIDRIKLEDGIRLHREKKALIEEYCTNNKLKMILPVTLITTKSIQHASEVKEMVTRSDFFGGYYKNKTLVVTSESEVDSINQLLRLEEPPPINQNEIVIHVDKLKEGWDVRNVFTIIPFRASISKTLIEQTIGRGLRLPFGELTGIESLDSLDIISHDNYARVLSVAHEVAEGIMVKEAKDREEMKVVKVDPTENKKLWIRIPRVEAKVYSSNKLDYFPIVMRLDELKHINPKLIKADIVTGQRQELGDISSKEEIDPINRFVRLLILEMSELDPAVHKVVLQKIIKHYLDQLKVDGETLSKLVRLHEQTILDDLLPQIEQKLQEETKIKFKVLDEELGFEPYTKAVKASSEALDKDQVSDAESRGNLINGYGKSVYDTYVFDSAQEKLLADSLDADKTVKSWVRLRTGQLPIKYVYGNYNPDFIVERSDANYLVEVKDKSKLDKRDPEVFSKAHKAEEWCKMVTEATGRQWVYKLVPHSAVERINSFEAIISSAYKVEGQI